MSEVDLVALAERIGTRLGPRGCLLATEDKQAFESSARHGSGKAFAVVRPATQEELAWTVAQLAAARVRFVVQGAATGLVGGATPSADGSQWVLSTSRVKDVIEVDAVNRTATVSAGYRLSELNAEAEKHGLVFPIDLGADPTIGGMVATNTGGARLIRYGGVRENLLDVAAILVNPAGTRVGSRRALRKNNTGLSWTQLLCGTFGSFGIVSQATVKLHPIPRQTCTAMLSLPSMAVAIDLACRAEEEIGDFITAFEGISGAALEAVQVHHPDWREIFEHPAAYAVLIELTSALPVTSGFKLEPLLMSWLEKQFETDVLLDAVVDSPEKLWRIRHSISESVQAMGTMIAFDVAVSRSSLAAFRARAVQIVEDRIRDARVCDFGHLGDGGVHLNISTPADCPAETVQSLREAIYELVVQEFEGSYSAEHGVGPYNEFLYDRYTEPAMRLLVEHIKSQTDPGGLIGHTR